MYTNKRQWGHSPVFLARDTRKTPLLSQLISVSLEKVLRGDFQRNGRLSVEVLSDFTCKKNSAVFKRCIQVYLG